MTRIVAISDTHDRHESVTVPDGDILVHAGDFLTVGDHAELARFAAWFRTLPHKFKVVVAGNHDAVMRPYCRATRLFPWPSFYLRDSGARIAGHNIFGQPWVPEWGTFMFMLPRGSDEMRAKRELIPERLDILVTHCPPLGILDTARGEHLGCADLSAAIQRRPPRVHIFGHIHEGYGTEQRGETLFVNASTCTRAYEPTNPPIVIDVDADGVRVVS